MSPLTLLVIYLATSVTCLAITGAVLVNWSRSFHSKTPVAALSAWHPAIFTQWFPNRRPRHAPRLSEILASAFFSVVPVFNIAMLVILAIGWGVETLVARFPQTFGAGS